MEEKELLQAILSGMQDMRGDIQGLKTGMAGMQTTMAGMQTTMAGMQTTMTEMQADISGLKQAQEATNQRLDDMDNRIEASAAELVNQFNAIIETKVTPQIRLIAEQHGDIIHRLKKLEPLCELTGRVRVLETVVADHTVQINELKKAQ